MSIYTSNKFSKNKPNNAWFKIFQYIPKNSRVLDLGCSSGHLGQALKKEKKVTVIGVEIDQSDAKLASKVLDEVFVLNVEKDSLSELGTFDVVIMADVIEHLIDPVSALKKIKKLLKPDGRLVFSIPNMTNMTTRFELLSGRFEYKDFGLLDRTHIHFYDEQEVNRVLNESGLGVKETDCTVRDIPENILAKELDEIGIKLTPKLLEHLQGTNAFVYQFIGYATLQDKPKRFKSKTTSQLDSVSKEIDNINNNAHAEIKKRDKHIHELDALVVEQREEIGRLSGQLNTIIGSKGWRVLSKAYKAKEKLDQHTRRNNH